MSHRVRRRLGGFGLLLVFAIGLTILVINWRVESDYRHVVVRVRQVDDLVRIDVGCRRVVAIGAGRAPARVDLGWMPAGELITVSDSNGSGDAAWEFEIFSDGRIVASGQRGNPGLPGPHATEYAIAMVETFDAKGKSWGSVGCDQAQLVSSTVHDYRQLPQAPAPVAKAAPRVPEQWSPQNRPLALIGWLADGVLPALALVGVTAALATGRIREQLMGHRRIGLGLGLFLAFDLGVGMMRMFLELGPAELVLYGELVGMALLLLAAAVLVAPHTDP